MASRIAGITVEIGGDTTKLSKALESVNKTIKTTQSELKDVNKLLKLDPSNTEAVTQKQRMLKEAIEATKDMLGITFRYADGRITVFRSALESIGRPEFYHFLYNPTKQMFAIQACGMDAEGANRVPKKNQDDRYEIKSKNFVRLIYQSCGWDRTRSYRLPGVEYPQQRLVNYDLCHAIPIFEGKVDKGNESTQEQAQTTSGTENI